jgi:putative ABC transport system permease protein
MTRLSLRTAATIAWRETRASVAKFLFVILAVAAGVGALAGVRGFAESFRTMLRTESRTLMAADLWVRTFDPITDRQKAQIDALRARDVDYCEVAETVSLAGGRSDAPVLASLKSVAPGKYPYYGQVQLSPEMPLPQALSATSVVVSEDLLRRLNLQVGDNLRLGGHDFRIAALLVKEPDRMTGTLNIGYRVMLSREAIDRAELIRPGSRVATRYLFKLGPTARVDPIRNEIERILPGTRVADYRQANPVISRTFNRVTTFLSFVSLIAMIVGALGVGMAMHAHVQNKLDNIAVMKSLGARSREIISIYLLQTLFLGLGGGLAGILLGRAAEAMFPALIEKYFAVRPQSGWSAGVAAQGIGLGLFTTLLFTLPPLLAIRRVRPALILRRGMADTRAGWRDRWRNSGTPAAAALLILAGIAAIGAWLADSLRMGAYFAGGLAGALAALAAVAWLMLLVIRRVLRRAFHWPLVLRHGMLNLYRQGSQAQAILVALGLGVMLTLTVFLIQNSLLDDLAQAAPRDAPNVVLIGLTAQEADAALELMRNQPGLESRPELAPIVQALLVSIDGARLEGRPMTGWMRRYFRPRSVMWQEQRSRYTRLMSGTWWKAGAAEPLASVDVEAAQDLRIRLGSQLEFTAHGQTFTAKVVAFHEGEFNRNTPNTDFVFNRKALEGLPVNYYGALRLSAGQVAAFQKAMYQKFPGATVVSVADALRMMDDLVNQLSLAIRFLAAFAILAGAIILAASVAGTRFRRLRELAILKTLGATRRYLLRLFSVEFLALGAVAGLLGSLLAAAFTSVMASRLFDVPFQFDAWSTVVAMILTALLANASGWLASARILGQKPLEALRDE